jgi:hypothetical protein
VKKLVGIVALSSILAGCGVSSLPVASPAGALSPQTPATATATAPTLGAAPADPTAQGPALTTTAPKADPYAEFEAQARELAKSGPVVSGLESLEPPASEHAIAVQTTPYKTQAKADQLARAWASDAREIWLGWGFKYFSIFGRARHVYYSKSKRRRYTIDFGFWGNVLGQYEDNDLLTIAAGNLIAKLLQEPRDVYPVDGRRAYNYARQYGWQVPTNATVKTILICPYLIGPKWVFMGEDGKPGALVDANTGEVTTDGLLLTVISILF